MTSMEMKIICDLSDRNTNEQSEYQTNEKRHLLSAALNLLPLANDRDTDDKLERLLLLNAGSSPRTDIENILNLNNNHEDIVKCIIEIVQNGDQDETIKQLLEIAVKNGNLNVTEMLIEPILKSYENEFNEMTVEDVKKYLDGLLEKCCNRGHDNILKFLLSIIPKTENDFINKHPLLCTVVKELNPRKSTYPAFQRCFSILLEDDRVMIDRAEVSKRTPLFYAAGLGNDFAQKKLLGKGACLGTMDMRHQMTVKYIDPILLEDHLNTCVTDNDKHLLDDECELTLDFKNFIPKHAVIPTSNFRSSSLLIASEEENQEQKINQQLPENELSTILELAQDSVNHRVLQHPVITCILAVKRADLCWFRKIYCLYYLIHYILLMLAWISCNYATDNCVTITLGASVITVGLMMYMIIRSLICIGLDFCEWKLQLLPNISYLLRRLLWRLVQLIPISLLIEIMYKNSYPWISAISMIVLAIESTSVLLKVQWGSISTNLIMFMRVLYTFCESLIPFSTIIISFLISFHILFRDIDKSESASLNQNTTQAAQNVCEEMNKTEGFQTVKDTGRKVFIMMAGELNTEKMDLQTAPRFLMFFAFVLVIVIVWNNFMNSLAVDDTVGMRAKSQFLAIKQDVIFMQRLETLLKILEKARDITGFRRLRVCRWPQLKSLRTHITIKPNDKHPKPDVQIDKKIAHICKTITQKSGQICMVQ